MYNLKNKRQIHMPKITAALVLFIIMFTTLSRNVSAQNSPMQRTVQGTVVETTVIDKNTTKILVKLSSDEKPNQTVSVVQDASITPNKVDYDKGDEVMLLEVKDPLSNKNSYYITDHNRTNALLWLFLLFSGIVLLVSKKWAVYSLLGMAYSFFVIFNFILPRLLSGQNPLFIAILGSLFIAPVTFYLSHGINKKTTLALISTLITLFITGVLALVFINVAKLTGFGSDEAFFLQIAKEGTVNIKGILLAGIIIGTLGILDDVTISQASIVQQLKSSIRGIDTWELYKKAMAIGHDHIASTVNTLVLVYTGAALPLLLLFVNSSKTFGEAINAEIIADEIVRTLVGSIGLVLAVPISTFIASAFIDSDNSKRVNEHRH